MKAAIIYGKYLDYDVLDLHVGGVETYLFRR